MIYLITTNCHPPFFTNYYDYENHYSEDSEMVVYDLHKCLYTEDGITWKEIEQDHL